MHFEFFYSHSHFSNTSMEFSCTSFKISYFCFSFTSFSLNVYFALNLTKTIHKRFDIYAVTFFILQNVREIFIHTFHFNTFPPPIFIPCSFYKFAFENFNYISKLFLVHLKFNSITKAIPYNSSFKKQILDEVGIEPTTIALSAHRSHH